MQHKRLFPKRWYHINTKGSETDKTCLGERVHDAVVEVHSVQVAVVGQEDLHKVLGRVGEGGHDVQHLPLVLEGAVLALQYPKEDCRDEHLNLRLEVCLKS